MPVKKISSVADLLDALETDHGAYEGALWFRGQADANWALLPGYLRLSNPPSESTLLKRFKQSAAMLLDRDPKDSFDWLFLMQHYGLPTRLLDWSESPLVALYFAVTDPSTSMETDAALWVLQPTELNRNAKIDDATEPFFIPSFDDEELRNYSLESLSQGPKRTRLHPIATIATRNNPRIQAQLGVFTIHHLDDTPIERIGDCAHITYYQIPSAEKPKIQKQLQLLGFSKFTMFPELSSVGDNIKRGLK
ncbi:FRG domain-containing protein [Methyloversatilis discipulorum]|uniref:FRG domain-containing protein n=1 Tax=Methyloversatilis discipulorum TaxID=1119528 RepID=UPI0009DB7CD2|nr:FRG domain-containing protein [Methyloversatilis discipulorum]